MAIVRNHTLTMSGFVTALLLLVTVHTLVRSDGAC